MCKAGRSHSGITLVSLSAQAALVGVVISWKGVEIDGYPGTALLGPVSATMARRRQKARAQTLTLCHSISTKPTELLGALLNSDGMKERKSSSLCTEQDGPLRPHFQSKIVQKTKGRNTMEYEMLHRCLPRLPCKQNVRILMLVPPQRNLHLMPPKARLGFC